MQNDGRNGQLVHISKWHTLAGGEAALVVGSALTAGSWISVAALASCLESCFTSALGSTLRSTSLVSCLTSRFGGGGRRLSAGGLFLGLAAGLGLRDLELLLQASQSFLDYQ